MGINDRLKFYFILPNGIGDTLLMGSIHHLLEEKYGATIVFIIKRTHIFILESQGIKDYQIENYSREELYDIARKCPIPEAGKKFVAHPTFHNNGEIDKLFLEHHIDFVKMYSIFLGIPLNRIEWNFKTRSATTDLLVKVKKCCGTDDLNKVVVFAPEMNSGAEYEKIQPGWAKMLLEKIRKKYSYVIFNVTKSDFIINRLVEFSLEEIIIIGMNCRKVITARSGLADVLCGNVRDMDVIYPNVGFYDLFKLGNIWGNVSKNISEHVLKLADYIKKHGYRKICIYGYGEGGNRIRYSLEKEGYLIDYAVDKMQYSKDIRIYRPNEKLPKTDIMIVCVKDDKETIVDGLEYPFEGKVVEMREIMEEMIFPDL